MVKWAQFDSMQCVEVKGHAKKMEQITQQMEVTNLQLRTVSVQVEQMGMQRE